MTRDVGEIPHSSYWVTFWVREQGWITNHLFYGALSSSPTVAPLTPPVHWHTIPGAQLSLVIQLCRPTELAGSPWTSESSSIERGDWPSWSLKSFSDLAVSGPQCTVYKPCLLHLWWTVEPQPPSSLGAGPVCVCVPISWGYRCAWRGREASGRWGWVSVNARKLGGIRRVSVG